jgi:dipeptidase E
MKHDGKLFLGGGGDENQSFELDQKFVEEIGDSGQILYLPIAQQGDATLYASCLKWFTQTMKRHEIPEKRITMWTTFSDRTPADFGKFKGIYIGGGMTGVLCQLIRKADMQTAFSRFLESGNSIYGGSAGAIALGDSLLAIPEEMLGTKVEDSKGLGLVPNFSFRCHFRSDDKTSEEICRAAAKRLPDQRIIGIPETSGLVCFGGECRVIGQDPVTQFFRGEALVIQPNTKFSMGHEPAEIETLRQKTMS